MKIFASKYIPINCVHFWKLNTKLIGIWLILFQSFLKQSLIELILLVNYSNETQVSQIRHNGNISNKF
jgi:hypothetical protein